MNLALRSAVLGQTDTKTNTKGNGNDDEKNNEGAPPLELAATASVFIGNFDLLVALFNVLDCVLRVRLSSLNDRLLLLDQGSELLVENGKLGKSLFNTLKLTVAGADVAEHRAGVSGTVRP